MNLEVIVSLFRQILVIAGTYVAATGYVNADQWASISGALITLLTTGYMVWTRWNTAKVPAK